MSAGKDQAKTILVIDDEPNILYALEETVKAGGYRCLHARDGEAGLRLAFEEIPDLIITDVIMPKVNGYELCQTVKYDQRTRHIPVILVTVRTAAKDIAIGKDVGADAYITKPFKLQDLLEKIRLFLPVP